MNTVLITRYLVPGVSSVSLAESSSVVTLVTLVTKEEAASVATAL